MGYESFRFQQIEAWPGGWFAFADLTMLGLNANIVIRSQTQGWK